MVLNLLENLVFVSCQTKYRWQDNSKTLSDTQRTLVDPNDVQRKEVGPFEKSLYICGEKI